jgi:uroporphyrinogen decarboxylase
MEEGVARRLDEHYGSDRWRRLVDNAIVPVPTPDMAFGEGKPGTGLYTDRFGSVWRRDSCPVRMEEPALKEPSLRGLRFPDVAGIYTEDWKRESERFIAQRGGRYFLMAFFGFGLFERTWALRGFENAMMDATSDPDFYDELLERIVDHQLRIVSRLLELPLDGIFFTDDWSYQNGVILGPERWRRMVKPRLARLYGLVHAAGRIAIAHCCGSVADILADLVEIGLDVYESVQPEARDNDPYELKRRFGDRIAFWGGLGSQSLIPFGSPVEIRSHVARLCSVMGRGGGYILAPSKGLMSETPTANAAAVLESFLQQAGVDFPAAAQMQNDPANRGMYESRNC